MITRDSRPCLAAKARLRWDRQTNRYLLLAPERGLLLNESASAILLRCLGEQTVEELLDRLALEYPDQHRQRLEHDVVALLDDLAHQGLLHDGAAPPS